MRQRSWLALAGVALLLTSCSEASKPEQVQVAPTAPAKSGSLPATNKAQSFPNPVVNPMAVVQVPAVPGLLQPTNANARLSTVATGRVDPFAALPKAPLTLAPAPRSVPAVVKVPTVTPLPGSSTALPPVSPNTPLGPLPAPISPTALAEAIEITGAVQVGNQWQIIVKESGTETSRRVGVGDFLANGKVQIKRVIGGSGGDPIVVLQQDGVEITKSIGSAAGRVASR